MRPLCSSAGDIKLGAVISHQWFIWSDNHQQFPLSYLSLLQTQEDFIHHNMACNICLGLWIYIHTVNQDEDCAWAQLEEHLELPIEWIWRCTVTQWWSEFGDELGTWHQVNSEVSLGATIEQAGWWTWSQWSWELEGDDGLHLEMHFVAEIECTQRCSGKSWLCELGDALLGRSWSRFLLPL